MSSIIFPIACKVYLLKFYFSIVKFSIIEEFISCLIEFLKFTGIFYITWSAY